MYAVSEAYKQQIEKTLRNPSRVRITLGIVDPDAVEASTITDNNAEYISDSSLIATEDLTVAYSYDTLEMNRFMLDGKAKMPVEENWIYQGYVSKSVSGADGTFEENPVVTITFSDYFEFAGLTMTFDKWTGDYPTEIKAGYYNDGELVSESLLSPKSVSFATPEHIPICNEIRLEFVNTGLPYRRVRLNSIVFGIVQILTNVNIASSKYTQEADIISSALPKNDFDFTIFDTDRLYDPENPSGVWEYLDKKQTVSFELGYELDNGSTEWQKWGSTLTTGDVSVNRTGIATELTIKTKTILGHLTETYDESTYSAEGISLKQLAMNAYLKSGYAEDEIVLDDALDLIKTYVPLEPMAINVCLQIIANAGMCMMGANRLGYPTIYRENIQPTDFSLTYGKMLETPKTTIFPVVRNLITYYMQVSVGSEAETVVQDVDVTTADNTDIEFSHSAITEQEVVVGEGLTLNSSKFYAHKTVLNLTGTGKISIVGKPINQNAVKVVIHCNDIGDDLEISNPLISTYEDAVAYANWIAFAMARRNEYTVKDRGYPEIDVGDYIAFETNARNNISVIALKRVTEFSGAIKGEGKYLIGGDNANVVRTYNR